MIFFFDPHICSWTVATQLSRTSELQDCKFREVIKNKHSFHISSKIICKTNIIKNLKRLIINWIEGGHVECGYTPKTPKCFFEISLFLLALMLEKHVILIQTQVISTQWTLKRPKQGQIFFKGQIWRPKVKKSILFHWFADNCSEKVIGLSKKAIKAAKRP